MAHSVDDPHDAVIVGSGAGGAMAAYVLTKAGAKVLMLEAGRDYDPMDAPMLSLSRDAPLRGVGTPDKDGKRPLPTKDAPTELGGSFVLNAAVLGPAMMGLQGLQPQLGAQLAQGKCGDVQAGGGKK